MKKKLLSTMLVAAMMTTLLAGCGNERRSGEQFGSRTEQRAAIGEHQCSGAVFRAGLRGK